MKIAIATLGILAVLGWNRAFEEKKQIVQCRSFIEAQALEFEAILREIEAKGTL